MKYAIIGAGISALSIAHLLQEKGNKVHLFEADSRPGGLIKCSYVLGNLYHLVGGHVFNSKRQDVLDWFWARFDKQRDFVAAKRHAVISLDSGSEIDYPIENHLAQFPQATRENIIEELLELHKTPPPEPRNLGDFFKARFGKTLNELYFTPYNNKIWQQDIHNIALDWLEGKLPMPAVAEILLNNISRVDERKMVHSSFYYAKKGGAQFLADSLAEGLKLTCNTTVRNLHRKGDKWIVQEQEFDRVIYTGNIRELPDCLTDGELASCATEIAGLKSHGTTSVLCSIDPNDYSWIYLPSAAHGSHRIICTGNFSPNNNQDGLLTATIEFSEQIPEDEIRRQLKFIPFNPQYIAHHWEPCTYPVQDTQSRKLIRDLKAGLEPIGLYLHGRFAEWEYYNMDAAIGAAIDLAKRL